MAKLRRNAGEIKAKLWRNNGETLKIESTLPKKAEFFIQCPNDVMPDPDFFGFFKFQPGPVTQTVKILTLEGLRGCFGAILGGIVEAGGSFWGAIGHLGTPLESPSGSFWDSLWSSWVTQESQCTPKCDFFRFLSAK